MIIDDHRDTRDGHAIYLQWAGIVAIPVPSAEHALAQLEEPTPDLIVCDLRLPGMSGIELLQRLKARPATARIPVVLLTGDSLEREPSGAALLLRKPITPADLLANIQGHLRPKAR